MGNLEFLNVQKEKIEKLMNEALKMSDTKEYFNLVKMYKEIVYLMPNEIWTERYSHYNIPGDDGNDIEMVSTWEQKGDEIREHRRFLIKEEIIDKPVKQLHYDCGIENNAVTVMFDGVIHRFTDLGFDTVAGLIKGIVNNHNVEFYGDTHGVGLALADALFSKFGIVTKSTTIKSSRIRGGEFKQRELTPNIEGRYEKQLK